MSSLFVETRLDGAQEAIAGLSRLKNAIDRGATGLGRQLAKEGHRIVVKLTPRARNRARADWSKRGHPAIWRQWEIIESATARSQFSAVIRNQARLDGDIRGGIGLMLALEFGARPHDIVGRAGGVLSWLQAGQVTRFLGGERSGSIRRTGGIITESFERRRQRREIVYTMRVRHPGHRPFRMVQRARRQLQVTAALMLRAYGTQLAQEYAGLRLSVR
jgi:hypothetical protein